MNKLPPITKAIKPSRTLLLPPSTFADEWAAKPQTPIVIGMRRLSETDDQNARAIAAKKTVELYTEKDSARVFDESAAAEAYNDTLFAYAVARSICEPNDVARPHPLFPLAEDQVPIYFTSDGIRFVWDAIVRMRAETSPLMAPATDDDVEKLSHLLQTGAFKSAEPSAQKRARKLITAVLELIGTDDVET